MPDQDGVERALGKVEGKLDSLSTKIDAKFESFTTVMHDLDKRLTVVEATTVTPRKLLWVLAAVATLGSVLFGLAVNIGDRLWGG